MDQEPCGRIGLLLNTTTSVARYVLCCVPACLCSFSSAHSLLLRVCARTSQGSKREQNKAAKLASGAPIKKWNHGAPLSKKPKGSGVQKGANGRFVAAGEKPRDSQLPTSVPMPSAVEDITDPGMRAMWEMDGEVSPEPLGA